MNQCAQERTRATILGAVNWIRLREELKECRETARLGQVALARLIGKNKSTVNRIENVYGEPEHKPDLDTIELWVQATGLTLSIFFTRLAFARTTVDPSQLPATPQVADHESLPPIAPEAQIKAAALRWLAELGQVGELATLARAEIAKIPVAPDPGKPAASHRPPPATRTTAAERNPVHRKNRAHGVRHRQRQSKRR